MNPSGNRYLIKIAEMQKQSVDVSTISSLVEAGRHALPSLEAVGHMAGVGAAVHVTQNALTRHLLQNKVGLKGVGEAAERLAEKKVKGIGSLGDLSRSPVLRQVSKLKSSPEYSLSDQVAHNFYRGVHDVHPSPVMQHATAFLGGATVPELSLLNQEARHAGHKLRETLHAKGMPIEGLHPKEKEALRHVLSGDLVKAHRVIHGTIGASAERDVALAAAHSMQQSTGIPLHDILSNPDIGHLHLHRIQKTMRDKRNWATAHIMPALGTFREAHEVSGIPGKLGGKPARTSVSGGLGGGMLASVEPTGGGLNAFKYALTDPDLPNMGRFGHALRAVQKKMVGEVPRGAEMANAAGMQPAAVRTAKEISLNPLIHGMQGTVNEVTSRMNDAVAAARHTTKPV